MDERWTERLREILNDMGDSEVVRGILRLDKFTIARRSGRPRESLL